MGTRRVVILSIDELTERFQVDLEDHLNGTVSTSLVKEFVESIMMFYCYNVIEGSGRIQNALIIAGVDRKVVDEVSLRLSSTLLKMIQKGFDVIYPHRYYTYCWHSKTDLAVEENLFERYPRPPIKQREDDS